MKERRKMDTLSELKDYCNIDNPAGALMLTGEWGCGKTYFIENKLRSEIENTHVIIRVSLFGISDLAQIEKKVKIMYLQAHADDLSKNVVGKSFSRKFYDNAAKIRNEAQKVVRALLPEKIAGLCTLDIINIIPISNKIGNKKIVLVFDDLERAKNLDVVDVLGCINEYIENQHFPVIIVVNENAIGDLRKQHEGSGDKDKKDSALKQQKRNNIDKTKENKGTNSEEYYRSIKEKIVQRTVKCDPSYGEIIENIIDGISVSDNYKKILIDSEEDITRLFSGENISDKRCAPPKNLRSLKCGIQDFERVHEILEDSYFSDENDIKSFLFSFISYTITARANLIDSKNHNNIIYTLYPMHFKRSFILGAEITWILTGEWNEDLFQEELDDKKKQISAVKPVDKLKSYNLFYLDEDDIKSGFHEYLDLAYNGELSLNEYVTFICHSYDSRVCEYEFPDLINWNKVRDGINLQIDYLIKNDIPFKNISKEIGNNILRELSNDESSAYSIIAEARSLNRINFERNRKSYLEAMKSDNGDISMLSTKVLAVFDNEMVNATFEKYKNMENMERGFFCHEFEMLWRGKYSIIGVDKKNIINGFRSLKDNLQAFAEKCVDQKIIQWNTNRFIDSLNDLINDWENNDRRIEQG